MTFGEPKYFETAGALDPVTPSSTENIESLVDEKKENPSPRMAVRELAEKLNRGRLLAIDLEVMMRLAEKLGIIFEEGDLARRVVAAGADEEALHKLHQEMRGILGDDRYHQALSQSEAHKQYVDSLAEDWVSTQTKKSEAGE